MAMATFNFVPTPSALETSTGSFHFLRSRAKSAPKLPMPPRTPGVKVRLAWWRMRCLASSATAIFTPASAYFMRDPRASVSQASENFRPPFALRNSPTRRGGSRRLLPTAVLQQNLKGLEDALPAHGSAVQDGVRGREKAFANLARLPGFRRNVQRHINHDRGADEVLARDGAPEAAVEGVLGIVAHGKVTVLGDAEWVFYFRTPERSGSRRGRLAGADGVFFHEPLAVDPHGAIANVDGVAG